MAQKKAKKVVEEVQGIEVKLQPDKETPSNRIYSNYARVSRTPYDFNISFCDATPLTKDDDSFRENPVHKIPIVAEIVVPFNLVPGLINALQAQWDGYKKNVAGETDGKENP